MTTSTGGWSLPVLRDRSVGLGTPSRSDLPALDRARSVPVFCLNNAPAKVEHPTDRRSRHPFQGPTIGMLIAAQMRRVVADVTGHHEQDMAMEPPAQGLTGNSIAPVSLIGARCSRCA